MRLSSISIAAMLAFAASSAHAAVIGGPGEGPGGCVGEVCPHGPYDGPPVAFPTQTERYDGVFRYVSGGAEQIGIVNGDYAYSLNHQGNDPIGANGVTLGDATSRIGLKAVPDVSGTTASTFSFAEADWANRTNSGITYSFIFKITAGSMAAADALEALTATNLNQVTAKGHYDLSASGSGAAAVGITGGYLGLQLIGPHFFTEFRCDPNGYVYAGGETAGCGAHDFTKDVAIVRGSHYYFNDDPAQVGSALDFYGDLSLYSFAQAGDNGGAYNVTPLHGAASAFIDPLFQLPGSLNGYSFVIDGPGGPQAVSFVPEPGGWALLIGGFGLVGAASRRRRLVGLA